MHINYGLFASILSELASTVSRIPKGDIVHRDQLDRIARGASSKINESALPQSLRDLS
jgi:hypothetical protein